MTVTTLEGEMRTAPGLDCDRNISLERLGACSLQSEAELRAKLVRSGLTDDAIARKFESARAWMTTMVISERPAQCK
jgi:hypothetical protein